MPLDADVADLVRVLAETGAPALSDGTVDEARRNYDAAPKPDPDPLPHVVDLTVAGPHGEVPIRVYAAVSDPRDLPVVVFFHGGGWVLSSVDGHDPTARRLAVLTGALVVSVDYRLAPEHPFPAPHDDCWTVTEWLSREAASIGGDPDRIAVAGDSAGGNLAAGVAIRARDEDLTLRHQCLIYPCIDSDQAPYASMRENAEGYFLTAADMDWFWDRYVDPSSRDDPRAVPARLEDLSGLAPALVLSAEFDPLRDEAEVYASRLAAAGVPVEIVRTPGVVHGFVTRWHTMSRAHEAHEVIATALRRALA
ncbi:MAG: alpha/beta hydrolase [Ilumatobacteraceae bacterium]